jgi:hypothetical protein
MLLYSSKDIKGIKGAHIKQIMRKRHNRNWFYIETKGMDENSNVRREKSRRTRTAMEE